MFSFAGMVTLLPTSSCWEYNLVTTAILHCATAPAAAAAAAAAADDDDDDDDSTAAAATKSILLLMNLLFAT